VISVDEERLIDLFLELCTIPGESKAEHQVASFLSDWFEARGYAVERDCAHVEYGGSSGNLYVRIPGTLQGPRVMLSAHMDTVVTGGAVEPIRSDGVIRSSGETILGADDRSGIAAILEVVERLREERLDHLPLLIAITAAEEVGLLGARHALLNSTDADFGVVLDTSGPIGRIVYCAPYYESYTVVLQGVSAHAGIAPEKGVNAIVAAAELISKIPTGRISPHTTGNVAQISGGVANNIVPDRVVISGELRSTELSELEELIDRISKEVELHNSKSSAKAIFSHEREYDGYTLDQQSEVIQRLSRAAAAIGAEPQLVATGGGADANYFNQKGIPTAVISSGMSEVHTHQEKIAERDLIDAARMVLALVCDKERG